MKLPKNFPLLVVLLSVLLAVAAAVALHVARRPDSAARTTSRIESNRLLTPPVPVVVDTPVPRTPSAAAQKRAKDFNDAMNRFNAPDSQ